MIPTTRKPYTVIALRHGGTHLIIPTVRYLTDKTVYSPKGEDALTCIPSSVVIVFLRDPRNWLVSFFKWRGGEQGDDQGLARFMLARRKQDSPLGYARRWASRWVDYPGALTSRFEHLLPPDGIKETARIADFLHVEKDPAPVFHSVFGQSGTFTGKPSDWTKWFGPESTAAFTRGGGDDLVQLMGYE